MTERDRRILEVFHGFALKDDEVQVNDNAMNPENRGKYGVVKKLDFGVVVDIDGRLVPLSQNSVRVTRRGCASASPNSPPSGVASEKPATPLPAP